MVALAFANQLYPSGKSVGCAGIRNPTVPSVDIAWLRQVRLLSCRNCFLLGYRLTSCAGPCKVCFLGISTASNNARFPRISPFVQTSGCGNASVAYMAVDCAGRVLQQCVFPLRTSAASALLGLHDADLMHTSLPFYSDESNLVSINENETSDGSRPISVMLLMTNVYG